MLEEPGNNCFLTSCLHVTPQVWQEGEEWERQQNVERI